MNIVVIDNFAWNDIEHGVNISENIPFEYIPTLYSYQKDEKTGELIKVPRTFEDVSKELADLSDVIYLINVHCIFSNGNNKGKVNWYLQEEHGITIYRQLLKVYEKKESELKVVFFSPIKDDDLVKLKPENAVLKHHLVLPVPFDWGKAVEQIEKKTDWKIFNNASENLLSGFSLNGLQKIKTEGKKLLFIDDQSNEWESVFDAIFDNGIIEHLPYDNQQTFRENITSGNVKKSAVSKISNCHIVLSDFYLNENHEPNKWVNKESMEGISGFKLFKSIRETDKGKAIPFIMHTSSNKVSYYKVFDQNGVDDWIVKDIRPNTTTKEKKDSYFLFKQTIESFVNQYWIYQRLQSVWIGIQSIKNNKNVKWWYSAKYDSSLKYQVNEMPSKSIEFTKADIVSVLESSWFAIRRYLNKEADYEKTTEAADDTEPFLASSICNNLGKIFEMLDVKSGVKKISFLSNFIINVRNSASHAKDNKYFILLDAFICLDYLVYALTQYDDLNRFQANFRDKFIIKGLGNDDADTFPCGLLWLYMQFYNHNGSKVLPEVRNNTLKKRIDQLFQQALADNSIKDVWNNKDKLSDDFKRTKDWHEKTFVLNNTVTAPTLNENDRGQYLKIYIPNSWQ